MALLTKGIRPQPYGEGGRKVTLPIKATTQIYEGSFVALIAGACVPGTTAGAGNAIAVAETDGLGGATDGATRLSVWTDKIFIFNNGANAVSDATPYGALLYMEDDHTVGTGGVLGSGEGSAGRFRGFEDDGRVRVFVAANQDSSVPVNGTALANVASQNAVAIGRSARYLVAVLGQNSTVTLTTAGAVVGDVIKIVRTDASAFTLAIVNGGAGAGTLCTLVASKIGFAQAYFDGTNWLFDGSSAT